ncbi:MAG: putative addiction module antidote protein [Alcanivorax sp.]|jgi:probable addiction module antidote protein|nr:putative addiction module antidote protein [Alcanivorax sp.]
MSQHELTPFDAASYLKDHDDMILYLNACIDEDPGDGSLIRAALNDIARAQNMSSLARSVGMTRAGLYKALSPQGSPGFDTVLKITRALGLRLHADRRG